MSGTWDSANIIVAASLLLLVALLASLIAFVYLAARTPKVRMLVLLGTALLAAFGAGAAFFAEVGE
ncbi:MAG: hypothetical protein QM753_04750 [Thermomicrobiales bacterium]